AYPDYLAWCGERLVFTAGLDRVATHNKRLLVAGPPAWRPRPLWAAPTRAFGSLACAPDGRAVAVLSQPASDNASFFATRWQLWRRARRAALRGQPRVRGARARALPGRRGRRDPARLGRRVPSQRRADRSERGDRRGRRPEGRRDRDLHRHDAESFSRPHRPL